MVRSIKRTLYGVAMSIVVMPAVALAQFSVSGAKPGGVASATSASGLIMQIANFLLSFLAGLSVLMIVVSGIMYITSGGDSGRTETAKKMLMYSVVGLIVALLSYAIVYVVSTGLGAGGGGGGGYFGF